MKAKKKSKQPAPKPLLTILQAEKALGTVAERWSGRCYEIACALVERGAVKGTPVYGHWTGPIAAGTRFAGRSGLGFVHHGWVLLPDGRVLDPTRWVFEGRNPYIYVGPADHYDEGGNRLRETAHGSPPTWDPEEEQVEFTHSVMPYGQTWKFVEKLLRLNDVLDNYEPGQMTKRQLMWLANQSPNALGAHAFAIYRAIAKLGHVALIPIDNLRKVERENNEVLADTANEAE